MDSTLSSVLILSVMLTTVMLSSHLMISSNETAASSIQSASNVVTDRGKTHLRLPDFITSTGKRLTIELSNTGNTPLSDYEHMDIIVKYQSNNSGEVLYKRIPYLDSTNTGSVNALQGNSWVDKQRTPDFYQPGFWNRDEILSIRALLEPRQQANTMAQVVISTQNGVMVTGNFSRPYWITLPNNPEVVSYGGALTTDGTYIYALVGNESSNFWRFDIDDEKDLVDNKWIQLASTTGTVGEGGSLIYADSYIYALQGNDTSTFSRYDITLNTWVEMEQAPLTVRFGAGLTWNGSDTIYALRGSTGTSSAVCCNDFWAYDIPTNQWFTTTANTPENIHAGASLVYVSGHVYAVRGDDTTDFWKYNITNNLWTTLPPLPKPIDEGGNLVWTGNDHLFAWRGNGTADFWRYSIAVGDWIMLDGPPSPVAGGADFLYLDGEIYGLSGNKTSDFWSYQPRGY